jgi:hypothetical protein
MTLMRGYRCEGVRIEGDGTGVSFSRYAPLTSSWVGGSILQLDRDVRDRIEDDIMISLAGPLAADAWAPPTTTYTADVATVELERIAGKLEGDERFRERVDNWEPTRPLERCSDVESVERAACCGRGAGQPRTGS